MSPGKSRNCIQSGINSVKDRKLHSKSFNKSQKKKPNRSKTVCDAKAIKLAFKDSGQNRCKMTPYVILERLNLDQGVPISVSKLSIPVTENVEVSKSLQKTKIKVKNAIPPSLEELNSSSSNQKSFKNVKLGDLNETYTSSYNDSLCDINAASALFSDVNEIIGIKTNDQDFFTGVLKMKPITESSMCTGDDTCVPAVLDASLIVGAFKFYQWHKKLQNLPSSGNSSKDFSVDSLSNVNKLSSEAVNKRPVPNDFLNVVEETISHSLKSSSQENAIYALDSGAEKECISTASHFNECLIIREISDNSSGNNTNSVIKNTVGSRNYSRNLRKRVSQNKEAFSSDEEVDSSSDNCENNNDLELKICDVQSDCSNEAIQDMTENNDEINSFADEMSINSENENHSFVSNDEQDSFIVHESMDERCHSSGKEDVASIMESNQIDSKQHCDIPLNSHILGADGFIGNGENKGDFLMKNSDAFDRQVQSLDNNEYTENPASKRTNDVHEKISLAVEELSDNIESTVYDNSESKQVSCAEPDEQNSSSKGFYETDILADELDYEPSEAMGHYEDEVDQLDYEPSEASEIDVSETESCNGEVRAKQSHSLSPILSPENSFEVQGIQWGSDSHEILKDYFTGQHVKDPILTQPQETACKLKQLDKTRILCNVTGNSTDKYEQKTDTSANQTSCHSRPNNNDPIKKNPFCDAQSDISHSLVSELVDTSQEKSGETLDAEFYEMSNNHNSEGTNPDLFLSGDEEKSSCYGKPFLRNKAEKSRKRSIDSEDDSQSDSEHSFKRKSSNDPQGFGSHEENNPIDEFSQSKVNSSINNLEGVLLSIQKKCKNGKIDDALQIANDYILISDHSVKKDIFTELFFNIMQSIRESNPPLMEDLCLDTMKNALGIFYDLNLWTTELCSDIIYECLSLKVTSSFGKQLFAFCQKNDIHIDSEAVISYADALELSEMSLTELISLSNFISKCKVPTPKYILKQMLNALFQNEKHDLASEVTEICKLMCSVDSPELNKDDVNKFVKLCLGKRYWTQTARLICDWAHKGPQITWVMETLLSPLEDVGFWYEELAREIFGPGGNAPLQARFIFGQMGICLLMEASSKKHYDCAFDVLTILHRYNINYLDYQAPAYSAVWYINPIPNPTKVFVFPFTVAFTALDICLHLERPKDAFIIFKSFSLDLPKEFDDSLKLEIFSRTFHYLLKIVLALLPKDPLGKGIEAFRSLLSTAQKEFTLEQLSEYSKDVEVAYNKYMVCILNAQEENLIKEFYVHFHGPLNKLFTLDCQVLRGLIVFFIKSGMLDEANTLFHLGHLKNIYEIKKPTVMTPPWEMTVNHDWTSEEIKLTFLQFMEALTPVLGSKKKSADFDHWFSVKICIRNVPEVVYEVDCLNNCTPSLKRVSTALKAVDSKIQFKLGKCKNYMLLVPESFYNFWFSNYYAISSPLSGFKVLGNVRVPFGESSTQERSDHKSHTYAADVGCSESVDNNLVPWTHHSDERILDDETVIFDNSARLTSPKVSTLPQNFSWNNCNNHQMFHQSNVSKNSAHFSPNRTNFSGSPAGQDIFPQKGDNHNLVDPDNVSPKSNTPIYVSPRRHIPSTPPRAQNCIPSGGTSNLSPPKTVSTAQSPRTSFLKSPNKIVSPSVRRKSSQTQSPTNSANASSGVALSGATSDLDLPRADTNNPENSRPAASIETVRPKDGSRKTIPKKTASAKNRHSASCRNYKKTGSNFLKAKSKIPTLDLKDIKFTVQNDLVQDETMRVVKPTSGVRPATKALRVDSEESYSQCSVSEEVFQKITNFLKSKVMVKCRDLPPLQQQRRALHLAQAFIGSNLVSTLDKKTMKLLNDFSSERIQ